MSKENFELKSYDHKHRWTSYWYQIREIFKINPAKILEIGVGNGFLYDYLKKDGRDIVSVDINPERHPDFIGSVTDLPFGDDSFDAVLCFQVLEHLPFDNFQKALREMRRVSRKNVILSLPHWGHTFYWIFKIPLIKQISILWKFHGISQNKFEFDGEHYWEIGRKDFPLHKIRNEIKKAKLNIVREFIHPDSPFHHFFVLEK